MKNSFRHAFQCSLVVLSSIYAITLHADVSVTISVPSTTMSMDEQIEFSVKVAGERQAQQPVFSPSPDYDLEFAGTSSQVQIINGEISTATEFTYLLQAKKTGAIVLGPCAVESEGRHYRSNSVTLQVEKNAAAKPAEKYFFAAASVDNPSPYLYQQVVYTFKFYNRAHIAGANFKAPEFSGFTREDLGKQREYQENYAGQDWNVTEIKMALFPTNSGSLTIEPAVLNLNALVEEPNRRRRGGIAGFFDDSFMGNQRQKAITLRTEALSLKVLPLPAPAPGEAKTMLVGGFTLASTVSPTHAKVGDSLTLTVVVEGEGNIWDAQVVTPELADFKVYADKPVVKNEVKNFRIFGRKEFKFALVPQTPGTKPLPSFVLRYFDPQQKAYRQLVSTGENLEIVPNPDADLSSHNVRSSGVQGQQREVKVVGSDLMPVKTDPAAFLAGDTLSPGELRLLSLALVLGPSAYLALFLLRRRQLAGGDTLALTRRKKAYGQFKREFSLLAAREDFYAPALALVRSYLGNKFAVPGQSITPADVMRILGDKGIAPATLKELSEVLRACEEAQYGGGSGLNSGKTELRRRIDEVVQRIEQHK